MLKGSPYMLNSDQKIARAPANKENGQLAKKPDEKINIFSQETASSTA